MMVSFRTFIGCLQFSGSSQPRYTYNTLIKKGLFTKTEQITNENLYIIRIFQLIFKSKYMFAIVLI